MIAWKDNALVLMMTTAYTGDEREVRTRRRPTTTQPHTRPMLAAFGAEAVKELEVPSVSAAYNDQMGAVDIADQLRASEGIDHRVCMGSWRAIAWSFLLEVCLVNSYLLQLRGQPDWPRLTNQRAWRQAIIDGLINGYAQQGQSRKRLRPGDEVTPVSSHERIHRGKSSPCVGCKGQRIGTRKKRRVLGSTNGNSLTRPRQTRSGCKQCDVAICTVGECWYFWHSGSSVAS